MRSSTRCRLTCWKQSLACESEWNRVRNMLVYTCPRTCFLRTGRARHSACQPAPSSGSSCSLYRYTPGLRIRQKPRPEAETLVLICCGKRRPNRARTALCLARFTEEMQALMMSPKAADCGCPTVSYLCAPTRGLFASPRVDGRPGAGNCWPCCSKCRGFSRLTEPLPLVLPAAGAESTVRQSAQAFGKQPSQSRWTAGPLPQ